MYYIGAALLNTKKDIKSYIYTCTYYIGDCTHRAQFDQRWYTLEKQLRILAEYVALVFPAANTVSHFHNFTKTTFSGLHHKSN